MLKKVAVGFLILAVLGCITAWDTVFSYILCFVMLITAIFFGLLVQAVNLIWKFLPGNIKKSWEERRILLSAIILFSIMLFFFIGVIVDRFCLYGASGFISLVGNAVTFVFAGFWGWSLIKKNKGKTIIAGNIAFILFFVLLSIFSSTFLKPSENSEINPIEKLKSLPYINWVATKGNLEKTGVIKYYPGLAFNGINLYNSPTLPEAYLIDMHGNIIHKWNRRVKDRSFWENVKICKNGDLLVVVHDQMLIRFDWDSKTKWEKKMRAHHDVAVDENKNIYAIGREDRLVFLRGIPVTILSDYIVVLSPDGEIKKKIYIYDLVRKEFSLRNIFEIYKGLFKPKILMRIFYNKIKRNFNLKCNSCFDIMHTNYIEIIDRDIHGFCKKGDWLISIRELNLVCVVDAKKEELVWRWGPGELVKQHHPTLLKNRNILIFDNGRARKFSRIIELNPLIKKIVWEYKSEPQDRFFSFYRGSCQRLPNDNTLITESDKGHVFEITKEGKVVWEFFNPEVMKKEEKRAAIYRMIRITNPERYAYLREFDKSIIVN